MPVENGCHENGQMSSHLFFLQLQLYYIAEMSESADVAIITVHCILVIANIVGNTLVCVIIMKNREMRYVKIETQNYEP